jgi:hypothetical protein
MWKPALAARCSAHRFGAWVGYPVKYEAEFKIPGQNERHDVSVQPLIAAGAGFAPNKFFSLLVGFSVGNVSYEAEGRKPFRSRTFAPTVGIGGNLDIITALVKSLGG